MSDHEYNERLVCKNCGIGSEYGEQRGNRNCPRLIEFANPNAIKKEER